jgi:hypothetical protein
MQRKQIFLLNNRQQKVLNKSKQKATNLNLRFTGSRCCRAAMIASAADRPAPTIMT